MYKIKRISSIMMIFILMLGSSFADTSRPNGSQIVPLDANTGLPSHYPTHMMPSGKITKILKKKRVIILDGTAFKLHPVHDVFTLKKGQQATLYDLKRGMKVAFEFTTYQGNKVVHKVWMLPRTYKTKMYAH